MKIGEGLERDERRGRGREEWREGDQVERRGE